jgi:hypothetical protein
VPGDNVTLGGAATGLTGIVERITPMRTTLRTEDDILVTIPNKVRPQQTVWQEHGIMPYDTVACIIQCLQAGAVADLGDCINCTHHF